MLIGQQVCFSALQKKYIWYIIKKRFINVFTKEEMSKEFFNEKNTMKNGNNVPLFAEPSPFREKIKEVSAVEIMDEDDFDSDDLQLETFDEEGFEDSFFGQSNVKNIQKKVNAVDVLIGGNFFDEDENFDDESILDLQSFDGQSDSGIVQEECKDDILADAIQSEDEDFAEPNLDRVVIDDQLADPQDEYSQLTSELYDSQSDEIDGQNEQQDNFDEDDFAEPKLDIAFVDNPREEAISFDDDFAEPELDIAVFGNPSEIAASLDKDFAQPQLNIAITFDRSVQPKFDEDNDDERCQQVFDEEDGNDGKGEIDKNYWKNILSAEAKFKPHFTFDMKLRLAEETIKEYYSQIKNLLLSYGLHARMSDKRENFTKGKVPFVRMAINGKTLKVYLATDPNELDKKYFRHFDVGFRKSTQFLPTLINAKSDLAVRRICELIVTLVDSKGIAPKKRFTPSDFAADLTLVGYTKLSRCGYNYMLTDVFTRSKAHDLPEFFAEKFINERKIDMREIDCVVHTATLDELQQNFEAGAVIKLDTLIQKGLAGEKSNYLQIKACDTLDRPLFIYCDDITPTAAKMVCLTKGQVFRYSTNKVDFLHLQQENMVKR